MGQLIVTFAFFVIILACFYNLTHKENCSKENVAFGDSDSYYHEGTSTKGATPESESTLIAMTMVPASPPPPIWLDPCPRYYEMTTIDDTIFCYNHTANYRKNCPYPVPTVFEEIKLLYKTEYGDVLTSLRKTDDPFYTPFVWNEPSELYNVTQVDIVDFNEAGKDCVVYNGTILKAVSCKSSFSSLCVINTSKISDESHSPCSDLRTYKSSTCIRGSLDSSICYCNASRKNFGNRFNLCDTLAEPIEKYQSRIILQNFQKNLPCWFGLELNHQQYVWSSSNQPMQYTFWAPQAVFGKDSKYGAFTPNGWTMEDDIDRYDCAICQEKVNTVTSRALLYFNEDRNMLELYVGNVNQVYQGTVYCFCEFTHSYVRLVAKKWIYAWTPYPALYRCEFYQLPGMRFVSTNAVIAYNTSAKHNNEFALEIKTTTKLKLPILEPDKLASLVEAEGLLNLFSDDPKIRIRFVQINRFSAISGEIYLLYHITTFTSSQFYRTQKEFDEIKTRLDKFTSVNPSVTISSFRSSRTCLKSTVKTEYSTLTFPETVVGSSATPRELCLQENYVPIVRKCCGDFLMGGTWDEVESTCLAHMPVSQTTSQLYDMLTNESPEGAAAFYQIDAIAYSLRNKAWPVDVHYAAKIFEKLNRQKVDRNQLIRSISYMMMINRTVLNVSQITLNATDRILCTIDKILYEIKGMNVSFPYLKINRIDSGNDRAGVMVTSKNPQADSLDDFDLVPLYTRNYTEDLRRNDFELAVIVPREVLPKDYYYISIFYNDYLFNPNVTSTSSTRKTVGTWVVNILIPDATKFLDSLIEIYFKLPKTYNQSANECVHWRYGNNEVDVPITGQWTFNGDSIKFADTIHLCKLNHTTHFALLVSDPGSVEISEVDEFFLNAITLFESVLSVLGVIVIFATAIVFKQWRENASNKIVLNVGACLVALITFLFVSDNMDQGTACITIGALLHYTVLSKFMWMVIVSYSNYRRLVLGLHYHIENVVLKYSAIAWGVPIIFTACTLILSSETYDKIDPDDLCYPKGMYLQLGVLLPMSVMIVVNISVYIGIIRKITTTKTNLRKHTLSKSYTKQKSIFLLFFLMGLTWTFGLISAFSTQVLFYYLFSLTATIHGFTMFVYYILDFTTTREMWKNHLVKIFSAKKSLKNDSRTNSTQIESSCSQISSSSVSSGDSRT